MSARLMLACLAIVRTACDRFEEELHREGAADAPDEPRPLAMLARELGLEPGPLFEAAKKGTLHAPRLGRQRVVTRAELARFVESLRPNQPPGPSVTPEGVYAIAARKGRAA